MRSYLAIYYVSQERAYGCSPSDFYYGDPWWNRDSCVWYPSAFVFPSPLPSQYSDGNPSTPLCLCTANGFQLCGGETLLTACAGLASLDASERSWKLSSTIKEVASHASQSIVVRATDRKIPSSWKKYECVFWSELSSIINMCRHFQWHARVLTHARTHVWTQLQYQIPRLKFYNYVAWLYICKIS